MQNTLELPLATYNYPSDVSKTIRSVTPRDSVIHLKRGGVAVISESSNRTRVGASTAAGRHRFSISTYVQLGKEKNFFIKF